MTDHQTRQTLEQALDVAMAALPAWIDQVIEPWVARTPDAPALVDAYGAWTHGALAHNVDTLRQWLQQHGVWPGDRVMVVAENCILQAALILAISAAQVWSVNVNAQLSAREIDLIRDHSGARRLVYTAASPDARGHAARHGAAFLELPGTGPLPLGPLAFGPLAAQAVSEPAAEPARQVAVLLYTFGTTGAPTAVMLSHRNILFVAATARVMRGMKPSNRVYGVLPLAHIVGFATVLVGTLMSGGCVYFAPRFQAEAAVAMLEAQHITRFLGVPAMFQRIREHCTLGGVTRLELPDLAFISASGAPLDLVLKQGVERLFGLPLNNGYGITECSPTIAMTGFNGARHDEAVGEPNPGIELRLLGPDRAPVALGEVGEIHVRLPCWRDLAQRPPSMKPASDPGAEPDGKPAQCLGSHNRRR